MRLHLAPLLGLLALPVLTAIWLVAAPVTSAGDPCYHDFAMPAPATAPQAATEIKVMPCAFGPTVSQVATGATVTFANGSDFVHLITGANHAWGSRDVELLPGKTVAYSFDKPGLYPYACALHRGMSGLVVVGNLASIGDGSSAAGLTSGTATTRTATPPTLADAAATNPVGLLAIIAVSLAVGAIVGGALIGLSMRRHPVPADDQVAGTV